MKVKQRVLCALLSVVMLLAMAPAAIAVDDEALSKSTLPDAAANDEPAAVYPVGVTDDSYPEGTLLYVSDVKTGEEHYFTSFKEAFAASAPNATIYCKAGQLIPNSDNHIPIPHSLTIEGNGATQVLSLTNDGEATFAVEGNANQFADDVTFTVNRLKNSSVWGERKTNHVFTLRLNDCDSNPDHSTGMRVYINGTTGQQHLSEKLRLHEPDSLHRLLQCGRHC